MNHPMADSYRQRELPPSRRLNKVMRLTQPATYHMSVYRVALQSHYSGCCCATCAFRFLRQPNRPKPPRSVARTIQFTNTLRRVESASSLSSTAL
jgi:hypothetical protein